MPLVSDGIASSAKPQAEPRPPFRMMTHPERWGVIAGQVVPIVGHLRLVGGVNQVQVLQGGKFSARQAIAAAEERGWTVLDENVDGLELCQERAPGVWVSPWERLHPGSSHVTSDTKGYVAWLRKQIDAGLIPPPEPYVLERLIERKRVEVAQLLDAVRVQPSRQLELDRAQGDLQALESELERVSSAPPVNDDEPAPTHSKPRRRISGGDQ